MGKIGGAGLTAVVGGYLKNYRLHPSPWPPQGPGKNHADAKNRPLLWPKGKKWLEISIVG